MSVKIALHRAECVPPTQKPLLVACLGCFDAGTAVEVVYPYWCTKMASSTYTLNEASRLDSIIIDPFTSSVLLSNSIWGLSIELVHYTNTALKYLFFQPDKRTQSLTLFYLHQHCITPTRSFWNPFIHDTTMVIADFFWLDDAKFAAALMNASDAELIFGDKHNVRKRKGGKLGAWVGAAQAPYTLGISFLGSGIAIRNRAVAKRRLDMIHAELLRRGLDKHAEVWKDAAFATLAVGAGSVIGIGFAPGVEHAAQAACAAGAEQTASYLTGVAASQVLQHSGALATETATAGITDPDAWRWKPAPQKFVEMAEQQFVYGNTYVVAAPQYSQYSYYPPAPRY